MRRLAAVPGLTIRAPVGPRYAEVLTTGALAFLAELHRRFDGRRRELLAARVAQQADASAAPEAPILPVLAQRLVEVVGPVDRKTIIDALNSGTGALVVDFANADLPAWASYLQGQINLKERWAGTLSCTDPETGHDHHVGPNPAMLFMRPRGWPVLEERLTVDGRAISAALFDFGLYAFHNAQAALAQGSGPHLTLPAIETARETRLWAEVFAVAEASLGLPAGCIKVQVPVASAAIGLDEIEAELSERIIGPDAGR